MKQTSIDAYKHLVEKKILVKWWKRVYSIILYYGPITQKQVCQKIRNIDAKFSRDGGTVTTRFSELERWGVIKTVEELYTDPDTGLNENMYVVVGRDEVPLDVVDRKRRSRMSKSKLRILDLEKDNEILKSENQRLNGELRDVRKRIKKLESQLNLFDGTPDGN